MVDVVLYIPSLSYFPVGVKQLADYYSKSKVIIFSSKGPDSEYIRFCKPGVKIMHTMKVLKKRENNFHRFSIDGI